jgi:PTS system cellobiose-specific IIA component
MIGDHDMADIYSEVNDEYMEVVMGIIVTAGSARSFAMEAIHLAKEGKFDEAKEAIQNSSEALSEVHHIQTDLLQRGAKGEEIAVSLFMVHAQDHLMTGILARDLAQEIIELYEKLAK